MVDALFYDLASTVSLLNRSFEVFTEKHTAFINFDVREHGFNVGQYDWDYEKRGMDFLSLGGFAFLSQFCQLQRSYVMISTPIYTT